MYRQPTAQQQCLYGRNTWEGVNMMLNFEAIQIKLEYAVHTLSFLVHYMDSVAKRANDHYPYTFLW